MSLDFSYYLILDKIRTKWNIVFVSPNDEIFILKYLIELKIGIPIKEQRLIYEGKQLIDNQTIADYNIKKESSICLSIRLIG